MCSKLSDKKYQFATKELKFEELGEGVGRATWLTTRSGRFCRFSNLSPTHIIAYLSKNATKMLPEFSGCC